MTTPPPSVAEHELVFTRVVDAPRELVFAAWTSPDHLARWYGPRGFSTTVHAMDVRPGATTRLTMHGPDGTDYPNTIVYDVVDAPARLSYSNRGSREGAADQLEHHSVIAFDTEGTRTRITMRLVFPSAAARATTVRDHGVEEGGKQTLERLATFSEAAAFDVDPTRPIVTMTRVFEAPAHLLFATLVSPQHLARWWGPRGHELVTCDFPLRPGAAYRLVSRTPDGREHPFAGVIREVAAPTRVVMTQRYDVAPFDAHESVVTFTLTPVGERTVLTVTEAFASMADRDGKLASGMRSGAMESHDRLGELLDDLVLRGPELRIERTFDAPRALVWEAFTKPEHVKRWMAPPPLVMAKFECDLQPGGAIAMVMRAPDGTEFASTGTVTEVVVGELYAWRGTIMPGLDVDSVVRFTDAGPGKTTIAVHQRYSKVAPPTMGAKMGWMGSFEQFEKLLRELRG